MGEHRHGMRRGAFTAAAGAIVCLGLLQSAVHLEVVLGEHRLGTPVDLDRSNGIPDLVSSCALAAAVAGALALARRASNGRRIVPAGLACSLSALTLADLLHDGPHPTSGRGWLVIGMVVGTGVLLAAVAAVSGARARLTLGLAGCVLLASFLVNGLDRYDPGRFQRARGEAIAEYQIVAKEGLELVGWSLVALALWDEALRLRAAPARRVA